MKVTPSRLAVGLALITAGCFSQAYGASVTDSYKQYQIASAQGDVQQALVYAKAAFEQGQTAYAQEPENRLNLNYNLALAYANAGNTEQAIEQFNNVVEQSESVFGKHHLRTVAAKLELAKLYTSPDNGLRQSTAIHKYKQISRELLDGLDEASAAHPDDAAQLYYLVVTRLLSTNTPLIANSGAINIVERGFALAITHWGEQDTRTLDQAFILGKRLFSSRDFSKAALYLNTVATTLDNHLAYSHPWSLQAHAMLSACYEQNGNAQLAAYHSDKIQQMTPWSEHQDPLPLMRQSPGYPHGADRKRDDATVTVSFDLNEKGEVVNASIVNIDGSRYFGDSALEAVKQWRYAPQIKDGQAVAATGLTVNVDFAGQSFYALNNIDWELGYHRRDDLFDSAAYRVVKKDSAK
ncbi:TonB family protein [Alteromonas sp. AMM-1]|uniref:TonB family protein n=1 Tax=Alteromonas sp. AMM-1 TaxID=3394233 RepID=UPI0039A6822C